ncbi:MAG: type 4a pilus biogenesis protein PilO [PVC group bacterium]|nr:type 4a pilus biogenesis protein PilO [PVC group bacterium]
MKNNFLKITFKFMSNLKLAEKMIIALVIMLLLGYLGYQVFLSSLVVNLISVKKQLSVQDNFLSQKKQKIRRLRIINERYKELQSNLVNNNEKFFSDEQSMDFLKGLNKLVESKTNNDLMMIQPIGEELFFPSDWKKNSDVYKSSDIQIEITGQFSTIKNLFQQLYSLGKLMSIKELDIQIQEEEPLLLKADFVLKMYLLGQGTGIEGDEKK